jgi:hypothetical protein
MSIHPPTTAPPPPLLQLPPLETVVQLAALAPLPLLPLRLELAAKLLTAYLLVG